MSKLSQFKQSQETNFPTIRPTLDLKFALTKRLDPRITFTRGSTGTYIGPDGLIKTAAVNEPRFDYDPITGECKGLLIEGSATNYIYNSQTLYNDGTTYSRPDSTVGYTVYNSGGPNNGSFHRVTRINPRNTQLNPFYDWSWEWKYGTGGQNAFPDGTIFVFSCYARSIDGSVATIKFSNPDGQTVIHSITKEWKRVYGAFTAGYSGNGWFRINRSNPDIFAVGSNFDIACLQAEIGGTINASVPTSYIPTSGSTVTRSADNASMTETNFSSWYNQTEGTFIADTSNPTYDSNIFSASTGTTDNTIEIRGERNPDSRLVTINNSPNSSLTQFNYTYDTRQKVGLSYSDNNVKIVNGGIFVGEDLSVSIPTTVNKLILGANAFGANYLRSSLSRLTYYPLQLSNTQLVNLTS